MKTLTSFAVGIAVPAFIMAGGLANSAFAQEKAAKGSPVIKVLLDNDKVRAQEITWKPGDVNASIATSSYRVNQVIKGGTLLNTYADGQKKTVVRKTGEVYMLSPSPAYTATNIGKTEMKLYSVVLK
jgi:hypothetical protein